MIFISLGSPYDRASFELQRASQGYRKGTFAFNVLSPPTTSDVTLRLPYGQEFSGGQYGSGSRRGSEQRYDERYDDVRYGQSHERRYRDESEDVHSPEFLRTLTGQNRRYTNTAGLRNSSDFSPLDYGSRLERMRDTNTRHYGRVTSLYERDSMQNWRNDSRRDLNGKTLRDSRRQLSLGVANKKPVGHSSHAGMGTKTHSIEHIEEQLRQVRQARKSIQAKQEDLKRLLQRFQSLAPDQMDETSRVQLALLHKKLLEMNDRKQELALEEQYLTRTHTLLCDEQQKQQPQQQHLNQQHRHVQHRPSGGRRQVLPDSQRSGEIELEHDEVARAREVLREMSEDDLYQYLSHLASEIRRLEKTYGKIR